mmetsp:Transcript_47173/g.112405  ORF Transcript_47173/g.112405 Transcript_47173/m.112405 type:complete len:293 (+) Transcript_47173:388-1266(+)
MPVPRRARLSRGGPVLHESTLSGVRERLLGRRLLILLDRRLLLLLDLRGGRGHRCGRADLGHVSEEARERPLALELTRRLRPGAAVLVLDVQDVVLLHRPRTRQGRLLLLPALGQNLLVVEALAHPLVLSVVIRKGARRALDRPDAELHLVEASRQGLGAVARDNNLRVVLRRPGGLVGEFDRVLNEIRGELRKHRGQAELASLEIVRVRQALLQLAHLVLGGVARAGARLALVGARHAHEPLGARLVVVGRRMLLALGAEVRVRAHGGTDSLGDGRGVGEERGRHHVQERR